MRLKRNEFMVCGFPEELDPDGEAFVVIRSFDDEDRRKVMEAGGTTWEPDPHTGKMIQKTPFPVAQNRMAVHLRIANDSKKRVPSDAGGKAKKNEAFTGWTGFRGYDRPDGSPGTELECTTENIDIYLSASGFAQHIINCGNLVDKARDKTIKEEEKNWLRQPVGPPEKIGSLAGNAEIADEDGLTSPDILPEIGSKKPKK